MTGTDQATRCCTAWDALDPAVRGIWAWQVLHQLAHSDVPFTAARFAELAREDDDVAGDLIAYARRRRWIVSVAGPDPLLRGVLDRPDHRHANPARGT
jgi:hypothetical protein